MNQQLPPGWKQFLPLPFTPPADIHADSRSRLPVIRTPPPPPATPPPLYSRGMAPEGTDVAVLVTARAHEQQYDWTINQLAAQNVGVDATVIDVIRSAKPVSGLGEKEAVLIEFGRQLFGQHYVTPDLYARALTTFGERDLVDRINLMAQHADEAALLTAFEQQLPASQKPLLPLP